MDLLAKDRPVAAKDSSIPIKRNIVFQNTLNRTGENEGTFNLPEDRGSYLPLNLGADVRKSAAAAIAAASRSANPVSSSLQKKSSSIEVSQDPDVTDADFEQRHKSLKDAAWHWATENFSSKNENGALGTNNGVAAAAKASPSNISDVLQLCLDHPQLAEYVNFLASCPHNETWEDFFNTRKTFLAFAILGKVLEVHIFGQELFGASEAQVKVLRALDLEMVHQDGKYSMNQGGLSVLAARFPEVVLSLLSITNLWRMFIECLISVEIFFLFLLIRFLL